MVRRLNRSAAQAEHGARPEPLSRWQKRQIIHSHVDLQATGLELGPHIAPLFRKSEGFKVRYLESSDTDELRKRVAAEGKDVALVEEIDFVLDRGLSLPENVGHTTFGWATSSHVVEHIPDFVGHLQEVASVLDPDGVYAMIVPDRNYCFDCQKPPTSLGQILQAHLCDTTAKRLANMVDEWRYGARPAGITIGGWSWQPKLPPLRAKYPNWQAKVRQILAAPETAVRDWYGHQWMFDPTTFPDLLADLVELDLIAFDLVHLQPTYQMDFIAILKKVPAPDAAGTRRRGAAAAASYVTPDYRA